MYAAEGENIKIVATLDPSQLTALQANFTMIVHIRSDSLKSEMKEQPYSLLWEAENAICFPL